MLLSQKRLPAEPEVHGRPGELLSPSPRTQQYRVFVEHKYFLIYFIILFQKQQQAYQETLYAPVTDENITTLGGHARARGIPLPHRLLDNLMAGNSREAPVTQRSAPGDSALGLAEEVLTSSC